MTLVFLDVETTGLDPTRHGIWEIAYAVDDGPILSQVVHHDIAGADPQALEISGHIDRCNTIDHPSPTTWDFEGKLGEQLREATLVGANPAFDAAFLRNRWDATPWRYRLLDVEAYAMPALGLAEPKGLSYLAERLDVEPPNHSAAADVHTLRECFRRLQAYYDAKGVAA